MLNGKALVLKTSELFALAGSSPAPSALRFLIWGGLMTRVVFREGKQHEFIEKVKKATELSWQNLGEFVGVSRPTLYGWRKEKDFASYEALLKLSHFSKVSLPKILEKRPKYWHISEAARKGAYARKKIYGPLGTLESRRKGGLVSQQRRRENPEKYREMGCFVRKLINKPPHSLKLAEAFGILLGDGGISRTQAVVSLNSVDDKEYVVFVKNLFEDLFKIKISFYGRQSRGNVIDLVMSGMNLVDFLVKNGLKIGNKVKQQVAIPDWIMKNQFYSRACTRGLMDTDGCVFTEKHSHKDKIYSYKCLGLTNYSRPLIEQCQNVFQNLKIKVIINSDKRITIRTKERIKRYVRFIGTNNPKHLRKLENLGEVPERSKGAAC